jgi:hypothetical protein
MFEHRHLERVDTANLLFQQLVMGEAKCLVAVLTIHPQDGTNIFPKGMMTRQLPIRLEDSGE